MKKSLVDLLEAYPIAEKKEVPWRQDKEKPNTDNKTGTAPGIPEYKSSSSGNKDKRRREKHAPGRR